MSEQAIDFRSVVEVFHRHRRTLAVAASIGLVAGVGAAYARPAMYSSTSLVLLPAPTQSSGGQAVSLDVETQAQIAQSDVVLGPAAEKLAPHMSAEELSHRVKVDSPTTNLLRIVASAPTPYQAERAAQGVADADVAYLQQAASSLSQAQLSALSARQQALEKSLDSVTNEIRATQARLNHEDSRSQRGMADSTAMAELTAQQSSLVLQIDGVKKQEAAGSQPANSQSRSSASVIQAASPATRPGWAGRYALFGSVGLAIAVLLSLLVLGVRARRDRRLRSRDEIADAVGAPVVASVRSRVARSVAGWSTLLATYTPGTVDSWALRQALHELMPDRRVGWHTDNQPHDEVSVVVMTLSEDLKGAAAAIQLASYAASLGVRTHIVAHQTHESAASLFAACFAAGNGEPVRPGLTVDTRTQADGSVELTVYLAVVDRRAPRLPDLPTASAAILAVSAGSTSGEELARTAMVADDAGIRLGGVIVADPDDLDRTTGRTLQQARIQQVRLPTRLTGTTTSKPTRPVTSLRSRS